jgi:fibronectin type 3 domain-containing protein
VSTPPARLRWPASRRSTSSSPKVFGVRNFLIISALFIAGCGAPGEPVPPSPPVAAPITDLTARQAGDGVQLTFTMPTRSVQGDRLPATPAVEILRASARPDGSVDPQSLRVVDEIPGSLAGKYLTGDKFQFTDPIAPAETKVHSGGVIIYAIRTRLSSKRTSANSNVVSVPVFSVPQQISAVETRVTESAIELSWPPVDRTSAAESLAPPPAYNIYRAELDDTVAQAAGNGPQLLTATKLQLLNSQRENAYSDKSFEFGKTYAYIVRSVITVDGASLESSDSTPAIVTVRDTFPPAAPQSIVAAVLPGETEGSFLVDLSWSINAEDDFAGYRVYRSEHPPSSDQQAARGQLLTPELLPTPAYRDTSVQSARRYWYVVTAVDRAGNESAPGPPVAVEVVENSQP